MKYQLAIFWKNGDATGRVIDLAWPLAHDLKDVDRVVIAPYGDIIPMPNERSSEALFIPTKRVGLIPHQCGPDCAFPDYPHVRGERPSESAR